MRQGIALFLILLTCARIGLAWIMPASEEEAFHWLCAERLEWAYFEGPGGIEALIHTAQAAEAPWLFSVRVVSALALLIGSFALWYLGSALAGRAGASILVVALNVTPYINEIGVRALPAAPALCAWLLALGFIYSAAYRKKAWAWLWAGLSIAVGLFFRLETILVLPTLLMVAAAVGGSRALGHPAFWSGLLVMLAPLGVFALWNASHDWTWFTRETLRSWLSVDHEQILALLPGYARDFAVLLPIAGILGFVGCLFRPSASKAFLLSAILPAILWWLYGASQAIAAQASLAVVTCLGLIPWVDWMTRPLVRMGYSFVCLASALVSAWSLYISVLPPISWERVAKAVFLARQRHTPAGVPPAFLIAENDRLAAALALETRGLEPASWPPVFVAESQDLRSQFSFWPRYDQFLETDEPPNEYFTEFKAQNPYLGRDAVFVSGHNEAPRAILEAFERVIPVNQVQRPGSDEAIYIFYCSQYLTLPL